MVAIILFTITLVCLLAIVLVVPWAAWRIYRIYWAAGLSARRSESLRL